MENKANELGRQAFLNGKMNVPALDNELHKMITGLKVGDKMNLKVMKAWINGWIVASLAA